MADSGWCRIECGTPTLGQRLSKSFKSDLSDSYFFTCHRQCSKTLLCKKWHFSMTHDLKKKKKKMVARKFQTNGFSGSITKGSNEVH